MRRFEVFGDELRIELPGPECAFLERLVPMLDSVGEDADDPAATRLEPRAFADDEAQAAFTAMTAGDLTASRADDRACFADVLTRAPGGTVEPAATGEAWLRVLAEARLALAARWGAVDEHDGRKRAPIPHHRAALLDYLAMLQQDLVGELMSTMAGDR